MPRPEVTGSLLVLILLLVYGMLVVVSLSASPAHASSGMSGPGESWTLSFYYGEPSSVAALEEGWNSYYAQPDFQTYKSDFGWNMIRLGFCFSNMLAYTEETVCPSESINAHSSSGETPDLSWLSAVVSIASSNGMGVVLTDFSLTGQSPPSAAAMATWDADWRAMASYFSGSSDIVAYEFANELEHSTTTNSNLTAVMSDIRAVDPNRALVMWAFSPSTSTGSASYASKPEFTVPSDV